MPKTIDDKTLFRSRLAERKAYANPLSGDAPGNQVVSLANLESPDGEARPYRVFLGRLDRQDQNAPLNSGAGDPFQSVPAWPGMQFAYAAGIQQLPTVPPRRSNPVWGLNYPGNNAQLTAIPFVEVAWGMNSAFPQRMIAHWPAQGGSVCVTGSFVQVWAGVAVYNAGSGEFITVLSPKEWPILQAQITPESSFAPRDAGELSLTQRVTTLPFTEAVQQVDAEIATANGFGGFYQNFPSSFDFVGSLKATSQPPGPVGAAANGWVMKIVGFGSSPVNEARLNEAPTGINTWAPSANTIGVKYNTALSIAQLNALINPFGFQMVYAGPQTDRFTVGEGIVRTFGPLAGGVTGVPARWGSAVYVPDFARRVRVTLTEQPTCNGELVIEDVNLPMVPLEGDPKCNLLWFDDTGTVIDACLQGQGVGKPDWQAVPAGATMLGIYPSACGQCEDGVTIQYNIVNADPSQVTATYEDCVLTITQQNGTGLAPRPTVGDLNAALAAVGWTVAGGSDPELELNPNTGASFGPHAPLECEGGETSSVWTDWNEAPRTGDDPGVPLQGTLTGPCGPAIYTGLIHWRIAP